MLEYDNSAFYYFAITLLSIYLIPGTYFCLKEVVVAFIGGIGSRQNARTIAEKKKLDDLKGANSGFKRLSSRNFLFKTVILIVVWIVFIYLVSLVSADGEVSQFDPYQILGVESGAEDKAIKSAYRKLSLKYHPDKFHLKFPGCDPSLSLDMVHQLNNHLDRICA